MKQNIKDFLANIENLIKNPKMRNDLYALKRAYGKTMGEASTSALAAFYKVLPKDVSKDLDTWFVCATIAVYQGTCYGNSSITELAKAKFKDQPTFETKFNMLLDSRKDDVFFAILLNLLSRLGIKDSIALNLEKLLTDLLYWDFDSEIETVPQKWAREVYHSYITSENEGE